MLPSKGWIMSLGSRTASAGMTTGMGMGVITAVVRVTMEAAQVVTISQSC